MSCNLKIGQIKLVKSLFSQIEYFWVKMVWMSFIICFGLFVTCVNFLQRHCSLRYFHGTERDDVSIAHITISQAGALFSIENAFFAHFGYFVANLYTFWCPY